MSAAPTALRTLLTPATTIRIGLGWAAVAAGPALDGSRSDPVIAMLLLAIIGVILVCASGVVREAELLARRLGEPYGSLVLTLSIVLIEVVLIAAVMLGPGEHASIARDSVTAVTMIILNLVVGLCLLLGGLRHGGLVPGRTGASAYLSVLVVLIALALAAPVLLDADGVLSTGQGVVVIMLTIGLYAFFLVRQAGPQAADFREESSPAPAGGIAGILRTHRAEVSGRLALLITTVLPVVLLSHDMAGLLDTGLARLGAPPAVAGIVIAMIVFLPESITAVRAALAGQMQRVITLCHGALVSTVGLTVPAVLVIGMITGQTVALGESPVNLMLLGVTMLLSTVVLSSPRVTAIHGAAHLTVFAVFLLAVLSG